MPQLIAMVIVVVGAMIYMFQTFGGTGDKIESVAIKASVITEINNIKDGIKIAAKAGMIEKVASSSTDAVTKLEGLAEMGYFAEQINDQLNLDGDTGTDKVNVYDAISFGGTKGTAPVGEDADTDTSDMKISLATLKGHIPGIYVNLGDGALKDNAAFIEAQIANDLQGIAHIDRAAVSATTGADAIITTGVLQRVPQDTATGGTGTNSDGKFIIYFTDFGTDELVR
ncbi:hypothetical protein KKG81_11980 [bacterium]|jgi:hypothetical protein|nr:hypothetical protein [bacterium]